MRPDITSTQLGGITNLTVLATVKEGFVEGFDPVTYLRRLEAALKTLNTLRLAARESVLDPVLFPDFVGRFRIVHFFRFTIVPPDPAAGERRHKLLLNVTFDGGWEPYMRVIWRDLGTTLDLMFCNCEDYPIAHERSFDDYMRWVRGHEVPAGFFYGDSSLTVGDQRYLEALERRQRIRGSAASFDREAAELSSREPRAAERPPVPDAALERVATAGLRPIAILFQLAPLYPPNKAGESNYLLRVAHDILHDLRDQRITQRAFPAGHPARAAFDAKLKWFEQDMQERVIPPERLKPPPDADIQGGILKGYENITHGCLVLLRVANRDEAQAFLRQLRVTTQADADAAALPHQNVAFTFEGLRALGISAAQLDKFPQEFVEGMAARAGQLGDVRSNHPDQWTLPERNWPPGQALPFGKRIELFMAHLVVQLRADFSKRDPSPDDALHPAFAPEIEKLQGPGTGLQVLGVQAMRRYAADTLSREHFGFIDGFSQPVIGDPGKQGWDDYVKRGEVLLGHRTDRDDGPCPQEADPLLDNGSFLVVRKLKQNIGLLSETLGAQVKALAPDDEIAQARLKTDLLEKMVGRRLDGAPLVAQPPAPKSLNDFDYRADPKGAQCPFQSHIRRANPRDHRPMPRILRRGMSYGSRYVDGRGDGERGIVFMAYNASIAEQFEVIQRWLSGGNSSGLSSAQSDPLLGVPQPGESRIFRCQQDGQVVRVDLGSKPFVKLEWGLYLFVPSLKALRQLGAAPPAAKVPPPLQPPERSENFLHWQRLLEDPLRQAAGWQQVRDAGGVLRTDYGVLVGSPERVREVFENRHDRYSVRGYGERMADSIGLGYLGLDGKQHDQQALGVNAILEKVTEREAFEKARAETTAELDKRLAGRREANIDIAELSIAVLATLSTIWFGMPDGKHVMPGGRSPDQAVPALCPGHLMSASRFIFPPQPAKTVEDDGTAQGGVMLGAVRAFLADPHAKLGPLSLAIRAQVHADKGDDDLVARTIAGTMLGFAPTVFGNLRNVGVAWLKGSTLSKNRTLWDLQQTLQSQLATRSDPYDRAAACLRVPLITTMLQRPTPEMLWRRAKIDHPLGSVAIYHDDPIVLGIMSAIQGVDAGKGDPNEYLMFGGQRHVANAPMHACPGYAMAVGVMMGVFSALLEKGTLRPTASSTAVVLVAN